MHQCVHLKAFCMCTPVEYLVKSRRKGQQRGRELARNRVRQGKAWVCRLFRLHVFDLVIKTSPKIDCRRCFQFKRLRSRRFRCMGYECSGFYIENPNGEAAAEVALFKKIEEQKIPQGSCCDL